MPERDEHPRPWSIRKGRHNGEEVYYIFDATKHWITFVDKQTLAEFIVSRVNAGETNEDLRDRVRENVPECLKEDDDANME